MSGIDAAIVLAYLAAVATVGIVFSASGSSTEGYFLGKREVPTFALLLTIVATETSTVTFLSLPAKSFLDGGDFTFLQLTLGYVVGRVVVAVLLLPEYFSGDFFTAHEVLQRRFGDRVQVAASAVFLVFRNVADGLRLYLTALVFEAALDVNFFLCVIGVATATALYAAAGGVKSVVWNDCVQFVMYTAGAVVALVLLVGGLPDGWASLSQYAVDQEKLRFFDLGLSGQHVTLWSGLIGGAFLSLASHGADHMMVQRYLCARSRRSATIALTLSGPLVALQFAFFLLVGVALAAYYAMVPHGYDPGTGDRVFISYLVRETPAGLRGALLASVIAAAMSTLSSSLNASAGAFIKDLSTRVLGDANDAQTVRRSRIATVLFAVAQATVAIVAYQWWRDSEVIDLVLAVAGFSTGLLLGLYALGIVWRRATDTAGLIALAVGFAVCLTVVTGTSVHWAWYALIGSFTTFLTGAAVLTVAPPHEAPSHD